MKITPYAIEYDSEQLIYTFKSISSEQIIQKVIIFSSIDEQEEIYNLALCDLDKNGQLYDDVSSNNGDVEKIMATIISIIKTFFETYPNKKVFFEGNSASRTRLYQIVINRVSDELLKTFEIKGIIENKVEIFTKNTNYSAFIISLKK